MENNTVEQAIPSKEREKNDLTADRKKG